MLHTRHLLHPIRTVTSLARRIRESVYRGLAARQFRSIRRGHRDACWCGGALLPFKWHPTYGVCADCGSYVNRRPPLPEELNRLYSFDLYWHTRQQLKGYPGIERRPENDRFDGRVGYWLELIKRFGPSRGRVVEVGCAHAALLADLAACGYECIGVEPDKRTADWARQATGVDVRPGFFPYVPLPACDLFLAFDVLEHSPDPKAFVTGAAQLLDSGGVAIIQTPIDSHDYEPPFKDMFNNVFDDLEHLYIFTTESIRKLTDTAALLPIAEARWRLAHEIIVLEKSM